MKIPDTMGKVTTYIGVDEREAKCTPEQRAGVDGERMEVEVVNYDGGEVLFLSDVTSRFLRRDWKYLQE